LKLINYSDPSVPDLTCCSCLY